MTQFDELNEEEISDAFRAFCARHLNEEIEGIKLYEEIHRKDNVRTLHVVLILCLHLGVDPPDVAKISPCARLEAWYDPREKTTRRALETIGKNLQIQYERWQPKARYKQSLDPTIDEIHRVCQYLRRSAREERVLFHYNGHGVPRPTTNGEIWVFNKNFTKYIPLSLLDLQVWIGVPTVYVFDCNNAERNIIGMQNVYKNNPTIFENSNANCTNSHSVMCMENNIVLAACKEDQDIPQNPEVPADLFTACLTTPIKTALHWYMLKHREIFPDYLNESMLDLISGSPSNRMSMFGEINWVFTAVTDTIAWSCLSPDLFQKLFRQDLLIASLFRNFLLAERIMHSFGVKPVSYPPLPETHEHPMWDAWDHALDGYVSQLPDILMKKRMKERANTSVLLTQTLPIIPHPLESQIYSEETSDDDDDDIDDDDDLNSATTSVSGGTNVTNYDKKMIPRNLQMFLPEKWNELATAVAVTQGIPGIQNTNAAAMLNLLKDVPIQQAIRKSTIQNPLPTNNRRTQNTTTVTTSTTATTSATTTTTTKTGTLNNKTSLHTKNPLNGPSHEITQFINTEFFNDHMTAFELWLKTADNKKPAPLQLPILLQVLLSQGHRSRALRLLSEYMDLGTWAVINCLTVGIFPYVVRLLQSPVTDVKPYLVFIWGKIISSAETDFAKNDVVKDAGYKYFVSCLTEHEPFEIIIKTIATFTLAKMLINNPVAQKLYMNQNFVTTLIEELENNPPDFSNQNYIRLRKWFILCFAKLWSDNNEAKWYGVRQQIYEKLFVYLKDIDPEVRAATVYALGTFLNNRAPDGVRSHHAVQVDQDVCLNLLNQSLHDSSPIVRCELVVAMSYVVRLFWDQMKSVASLHDVALQQNQMTSGVLSPIMGSAIVKQQHGSRHQSRHGSLAGTSGPPIVNINIQMYQALVMLADDPFPKINSMANIIMKCINDARQADKISQSDRPIASAIENEASQSPKTGRSPMSVRSTVPVRHSAIYATHKHKVDAINTLVSSEITRQDGAVNEPDESQLKLLSEVKSDFFNWSCKYFTQPLLPNHRLISIKKQQLQHEEECHQHPHHSYSPNLPSVFGTSPPANSRTNKTVFSNNLTTNLSKMTDGCKSSMNFMKFNEEINKISNKTKSNGVINHRVPSLQLFSNSRLSLNLGPASPVSPSTHSPIIFTPTHKKGLLHLIDTVKLEDRRSILARHKQLRIDGQLDWNRFLNNKEHGGTGAGCFLSQIFLQKIESKPELIKFHPYLKCLTVANRTGITLWNYDTGQKSEGISSKLLGYHEDYIDSLSDWSRFITSMEFINAEEERDGLLMVGTLDGKVRIWRNFVRDLGQYPEIVTAWQGLTDRMISHRPSGLISHWWQHSGQLTLSGDVKYVRLWDSCQETKIQDMLTGLDSCVTCLDRSDDGRLVFAGFGDGHVKMFDTRASQSECAVNAGNGDSGWIQKVAYSNATCNLYSVGIHGDICSWQLGYTSSNTNSVPAHTKRAHTREGLTKTAQHTAAYKHGANNRVSLSNKQTFSPLNPSSIASSMGIGSSTLSLSTTPHMSPHHLIGGIKPISSGTTVTTADLKVTDSDRLNHLAIMGYGKEQKGLSTVIASTGQINCQFKYFEGFSRASIDTPTALAIHPYQNMIGVGLIDYNLLLLRLQTK